MALRRRQQIGKADGAFSFTYDSPPPPSAGSSSSSSSASSLAAKAIRASSAYRDSSLSSVYEQSALSSPRGSSPSAVRDPSIYDHAPKKSVNGSKQGFWGVLAQKAKSIIDEDSAKKHETPRETTFGASDRSKRGQYHSTYDSQDSRRKTEGPGIQKGLDAIASSLNYIGGTIGKSLEEGITAVENRTAGLIQETRKIQIRKKNNSYGSQNQASDFDSLRRQPMQQSHVTKNHSTDETQLKASRDVEMATTAKAKLLMREMNTVKADFAFAKDRCAQLEEENRMLRESREKGDNPDDDDLIRLQLESLLAEKARLAQENSVYARENRFLREIVEYHQLTMQDVVYFDEGSEEVTEVYPIKLTTASNIQPSAASPTPTPTPTVPYGAIKAPPNVSLETAPSVEFQEAPQTTGATNPYVQMPGEDIRKK